MPNYYTLWKPRIDLFILCGAAENDESQVNAPERGSNFCRVKFFRQYCISLPFEQRVLGRCAVWRGSNFFFQYWDTVPFCMGSNFFERSHSSPVRNFRGSCFHSTFLEELSCVTSSSRTVLQEMKYFLTLHRRALKKCTMMKWSQKSPVTFQSTCIFDCKQSQSFLIPLSPHEMHAATQHQ